METAKGAYIFKTSRLTVVSREVIHHILKSVWLGPPYIYPRCFTQKIKRLYPEVHNDFSFILWTAKHLELLCTPSSAL